MAGPSYGGYDSDFDMDKENHQRVSINQLHKAPMYSVVYGVVIAKCDPRFVATKSSGDRYVLNFTIRDSPSDSINAACWGDDAQIKSVAMSFSIGDVVKIKNPQIITRQTDSSDGKYKPFASSSHELNVSPKSSEIAVCSEEEAASYSYFLHVPVHGLADHITLADVIYDGRSFEGMTVNLLVAIKKIGSLQSLKSKDGRALKKFELSVFDETYPSFPVLVWDESTTLFLQKYCASKSILLISDVRLNFNRFVNGMMATSVCNTVFTPEPDIPDARVLYQYAQTAICDGDENTGGFPQICNIQQLKLKLQNLPALEDVQGILFAFITKLDIDGTMKITSVRCPECKQAIRGDLKRCVNGNCSIGAGGRVLPPEEVFDLVISVSDHTGTMPRCSLFGKIAEELLGCTVEDYKLMSEDQKTSLKWRCLLEKFKIEFKVPYSSVLMGRPTIRITACTKCHPEEVVQHLNAIF